MTGYDWKSGWWQDVPKLISQTDKIYDRLVNEKGREGKWETTKQKIYAERGWEPSRHLIEPHFDKVLRDLNFFYVPKFFKPGPAFVFPQRDLTGKFVRAQTKPLYPVVYTNPEGTESTAKYNVCGVNKADFYGPVWLGNDQNTLLRIMETGKVCLVEGSFDLLASRLAAPAVPSLCPLTKSLGEAHIVYLRILGVKKIYLMFDNEQGKKDKDEFNTRKEGEGNKSMRFLERSLQEHFKTEVLLCPADDPSECLKSPRTTRRLRSLLGTVV